MSADAPPGGTAKSRDVALFGLVLFLVALAPRVFVALRFAGEPIWDGHYYDFGARRIADGLGYSDDLRVGDTLVWHPWCHYPVGYSAFVAFFYGIFGQGPRVAPLVNAAVGAALAVVTWLLARTAFSPRRAAIAGGLVAFHPGLVLYGGLVMTEPLAALATLLAFWIAVRDPAPRRGFALGAIALGLSALIRPQALLCAPFLALVVVRRDDLRAPSYVRKFATWAAVACALALVPVLPWTARNCRVMDACALVSTNGGWNLAIGAFPRATGRFEQLTAKDGCDDVTGQVQQDRCWFGVGVKAIATDPRRWLALVPKKLGYTFDHESFPVEYLHMARPDDWPEPVRAGTRTVLTIVHRVLLTLAAFGAIGVATRGRGVVVQVVLATALGALAFVSWTRMPGIAWPFAVALSAVPFVPWPGSPPRSPALLLGAALLATTVLAHAVFFGEDRYHMVVVPVMCLFTAGLFRRAE
ncbi:MAG: glycosyltransferase family 39 protein [Polyangiaceae bacterium]